LLSDFKISVVMYTYVAEQLPELGDGKTSLFMYASVNTNCGAIATD
jgi:hypothetical protein